MSTRRAAAVFTAAIALSGCSRAVDVIGLDPPTESPTVVPPTTNPTITTLPATTIPATTTLPATTIPATTTLPATTIPATTTPATTIPATTIPATTIPTTTTPTTTAPPAGLPPTTDPSAALEPETVAALQCVLTLGPTDTLESVAARFDDETVDLLSIMAENGFTQTTVPIGTQIDICPGNGIDDITGSERIDPAVVAQRAVVAQQTHLNTLFAGLGISELEIDGVSGPVTRQRLCAARLSMGLPPSTADMQPGSPEEAQLLATTTLAIPYTPAILSARWVLIDETCQIMFVGAGTEHLQFVFPTSTGLPEFATRPQGRTPAYRYDPALQNNGWHNSSSYPAAEDNPLNGNMYRPLYFDGGQAIHGANNVPRSPASHGCARLRVADMDQLVGWLGLGDAGGPFNDRSRIDMTVTIQGAWLGN